MLKFLAYLSRYILGKELVLTDQIKARSVISGKYVKMPRKIVYYTDFHSEENWGKEND